MPKQKLTPWFPGDVLPARPGIYPVMRKMGPYNEFPADTELRFNGVHWVHTEHSSKGLFPGSYAAVSASCKWRGLASPATTNQPKGKP